MGIRKSIAKSWCLGESLALDAVDAMLGRRPPLIPPRWLTREVTADYASKGAGADEIVMLLKVYAGLTPDMTVFDLGCGTGRVAASLTKVLSPISQYFGVDIIEREIRWLSGEYSKRHPNFHFHYIDVYSPTFNPAGKKMTDEINFDFLAGQKVDIVFLVSVFTHLYPQQIRHYLKLARSILKPDGRLFASMFINDAFAKERQRQAELSKQKLTSRTFSFVGDGFYAPRAGNPAVAAAFDEAQIAEMWSGAGLAVDLPFRYGAWCGRPGAHTFYQDVVMARPA